VGCTIGCVYCNAQFRAADVRALDGRPARRWGSWIDAKIDAPDRLAAEVRCSKPGSVIFSPVITDPYVPLEAKLGITRRCLEVLADAEFSAVVLSRSDLVLRDLEVLARLKKASVGVSLPSLDDAVLQRIEPRGAPVARRLEVLRQARAAGLTTFAVIQPLLATPLQAWLDQLVPLVDGVRVDGLQERDRVGQAFAGIALGDVSALTAELKQRGVATDLEPLFRHPH
jgi:DNA repair photolyase